MSVAGAVVLYAILWALCFFIFLPRRIKTQKEEGKVELGTPLSAPADAKLKSQGTLDDRINYHSMVNCLCCFDLWEFGDRRYRLLRTMGGW